MARLMRTVALLALLAAVPIAARAGTVIDTYNEPLPTNYWLQNTLRPILFVGSECDGASCPPSTLVAYPDDIAWAHQSGVPGTISPWRTIGLARQLHAPADHGVLRIDPANGGSLILEGIAGSGLIIPQHWGELDHPMNLDLTADGSDHFEIDVLESAFMPDYLHFGIGLYSFSSPDGAIRDWFIEGPGTISLSYDGFSNLAPNIHDVDMILLTFDIPAGTRPRFVLGEFRTATTPSPTAAETWGRIKGAYRR